MQSIQMAVGVLVSAAVITSCAEQNTPTQLAGTPKTTFSFGNAPPASGLFVVRGTSGFFFIVFDGEHGLAAAHNGRDGFPFCGDITTVFRPGEFQDILNPADEILVQELFKTEGAFVNVYSWNGVFPTTDQELCDFLHGTRVARGTARLVNTDNDFFAFLRNAPIRADAFGFTAQGIVNLTGGSEARYDAALRIVFFPPDESKVVTARIGLTPNR